MIDLSYDKGIVTLRLNRPPVNAIDLDTLERADAALDEIEARADVKALLVTGTGTSFSAGLDLKLVPTYGPDELRRTVQGINRLVGRMYGLPFPSVAAVNGHAIAGGLVLVLACDYRVGAAGHYQIGLTEARAGVPFPRVAMAVVRAELSPAAARRLTLVARNVSPDVALADGIFDELQPLDRVLDRAYEIAAQLGEIPRVAYTRTKQQLRAALLDSHADSIYRGGDPLLNDWLSAETPDAAAGLLGKRSPRAR
jgi:enoyl-CoA hydratase